jgi:hypothetical protein
MRSPATEEERKEYGKESSDGTSGKAAKKLARAE